MEAYKENLKEVNKSDNDVNGLYLGLVLANNDPQQMERVRTFIYGIDEPGLPMEKYRWIPTIKGLTGNQINAKFGPAKDATDGVTSYGIMGAHRVGTIVCVLFIGGMLSNPVIIGALPSNDLITGLPGGNKGQNENGKSGPSDIQPTKANIDKAFGVSDSDVKDTRGYEVTGRAPGERGGTPDVTDGNRKTGDIQGDRSKYGYPKSVNETPVEGFPNEPMMFSYTTPGQHTVLMNDDPDNCRVRIRTVSGNQIILDDTNERIYISSAEGSNFIEMDIDGTIDIYAANRVSIHSENDINIKSDKQVNIEGTAGINLKSSEDINVSTDTSINMNASDANYFTSGKDTHIKAGGNINAQSSKDISIKSGTNAVIDAGADIGLKASGNLVGKGTQVQFNGPSPATAKAAKSAIKANPVNREPKHESVDWRAISATGKRSDAVNPAHKDQSEDNPYSNRKEGGKTSRKRPNNWRK